MQKEQQLNFKIFCAACILFLALFMCSIGYKVFKALAFPGSQAETTSQEVAFSRNTSLPSDRSNAIRENPFADFI